MSFDLFLGRFEEGRTSTFPTAFVNEALNPYVVAREDRCLVLSFEDQDMGRSYVFVDTAASDIESFCVNNPSADPRLYEALFALMHRAGLALYMPGEAPPLLADAKVGQHLPESMVKALGHPVVLQRAQEISEWIQRA